MLIIGVLKTCSLHHYLLLPISQQFVFFSEADCGLLNFTRVDQELREDPELDNDGYSLLDGRQ